MDGPGTRRVELLLPIRTILIVVAAIGLMFAFSAIGSVFLIVFIGIFLGLVFEYPMRFVMRKTGWGRGLAATVTVLAGDAGLETADYAKKVGADLIVVPSHGFHGMKRLLLGSTAERIIRHAHCSVLVLRRKDAE